VAVAAGALLLTWAVTALNGGRAGSASPVPPPR